MNRAELIEYAPRELAGLTLTLGDRQLVPGSSIITSLLLAPPAILTDAEQTRSEPRQATLAVFGLALPGARKVRVSRAFCGLPRTALRMKRYADPPSVNRAELIEYAPRELAGLTLTLGDRQLVPGSSIITSLLLAPPAILTDAEQTRSEPRQATGAVAPAFARLIGASAEAT